MKEIHIENMVFYLSYKYSKTLNKTCLMWVNSKHSLYYWIICHWFLPIHMNIEKCSIETEFKKKIFWSKTKKNLIKLYIENAHAMNNNCAGKIKKDCLTFKSFLSRYIFFDFILNPRIIETFLGNILKFIEIMRIYELNALYVVEPNHRERNWHI